MGYFHQEVWLYFFLKQTHAKKKTSELIDLVIEYVPWFQDNPEIYFQKRDDVFMKGAWIFLSDFLWVSIYYGLFLGMWECYFWRVSIKHTHYLYLSSFMLLGNLIAQSCLCRLPLQPPLFLYFFYLFPPCIKWHKRVGICSGGMNVLTYLMRCTSLSYNEFFKKNQSADRILLSHNGDRKRVARDFQRWRIEIWELFKG